MDHADFDVASEYETLLQFLYVAPVGLVQIDAAGEIAMINPLSAQLLMPLTRDAGLVNLFSALQGVAPDLRQRVQRFKEPQGRVCDAMPLQVSAGVRGQSDPQVLSLSLIKLDDDKLMAVINDISLQVKREKQLKQNEAWFNAILTGISDYALVSLDANGRIAEWNPSIGRVTGFLGEHLVGRPYSVFYPEDATTPERVLDRLHDADRNGWSLDDGWRMRLDGSRFWGSAMIVPLHDLKPDSRPAEGEPAYCLVIRDITSQREASESHRRATSCDHLTGIANRRAFFEAAEQELERWRRAPRPTTLVMFDADHFKQVNDTHGHAAGDAVLRHIAALMTASFRGVDVVARLGGEEFAVLLPSTELDTARGAAERLRKAMAARPVVVDGVEIHCRISGGVAAWDGSLDGVDAWLKRADRALYRAKAEGRDRIVCADAG